MNRTDHQHLTQTSYQQSRSHAALKLDMEEAVQWVELNWAELNCAFHQKS